MAALQFRNDSYRLLFQYDGKQETFTIGRVCLKEAREWKARAESLLMRIRQRLLEVPPGVSVSDFLRHDGKPPVEPALVACKTTTFGQLREAYLKAVGVGQGALESTTLATTKIHLNHLEETLGKKFLMSGLTLTKLQSHVERRTRDVAGVTIEKELNTLRAVWNWGVQAKWVTGAFPSGGIKYEKTEEKLPFMTWEEIERRIKAGGDAPPRWECLYLNTPRVSKLLLYVKGKKAPGWVFPMVATAAHTGARRSELIRSLLEDLDVENRVLTIREKKRVKGKRTTRRVPMSRMLTDVLKQFAKDRRGPYLFGDGDKPLSPQATHKALRRALAGSEWSVVKGWHVLRHSFISACASKGVDQRILDDWVGHQTDEQRQRYRHLYPSVQASAMRRVFG
jgi:integrase